MGNSLVLLPSAAPLPPLPALLPNYASYGLTWSHTWSHLVTRTCICGPMRRQVLKELILNGNAIGEDGARHLMVALKVNTSLQYLGLQVPSCVVWHCVALYDAV